MTAAVAQPSPVLAVFDDLIRAGASRREAMIVLATAATAAIELSFNPGELRDSHGRWVRGGAGSSRPGVKLPSESVPARDITQEAMIHSAAAEARARAHAEALVARASTEHKVEIHRMLAEVKSSNAHLKEMQKAEEDKKHRVKVATHILLIIGGAILAFVEAHFGVHESVAIVSSGMPLAIQELLDFFKRL